MEEKQQREIPPWQVGAAGSQPQNAARDFTRRFLKPLDDWPPAYWAKVPLDDGEVVELPFFLPHLYVQSQALKEEWALAPGSTLRKSLEQLFAEQGLDEDVGKLVPLALWGDGVPFLKKDSLFMVQLLVAMVPASGVVLRAQLLCRF